MNDGSHCHFSEKLFVLPHTLQTMLAAAHSSDCSADTVWLGLVAGWGSLKLISFSLKQIENTKTTSFSSECIQMAWSMVAGCHRMKQYFSPNPLLISSSSCCHAPGCTHQPISSPVQHLQHPTSHIINPMY